MKIIQEMRVAQGRQNFLVVRTKSHQWLLLNDVVLEDDKWVIRSIKFGEKMTFLRLPIDYPLQQISDKPVAEALVQAIERNAELFRTLKACHTVRQNERERTIMLLTTPPILHHMATSDKLYKKLHTLKVPLV